MAIAVGLLQHRFARSERAAAEERELRERGAAIAGPLRALVSDAEPLTLGMSVGEHTQGLMDDLWARSRVLLDQLAAYAVLHPSASVGKVALAVTIGVRRSLNATSWFLRDLLSRESRVESRRHASAEHRGALALADLLVAAVRGDVSGNDVATRLAEIQREVSADDEAESA